MSVKSILPDNVFDGEFLLNLNAELRDKIEAFKKTIVGGTAGQWGAVECLERAMYDIHGAAAYLWKDTQ